MLIQNIPLVYMSTHISFEKMHHDINLYNFLDMYVVLQKKANLYFTRTNACLTLTAAENQNGVSTMSLKTQTLLDFKTLNDAFKHFFYIRGGRNHNILRKSSELELLFIFIIIIFYSYPKFHSSILLLK